MTIVHIAGVPDGQIQRCIRCSGVLIDSTGAMSMGGEGIRPWPPGSFVWTEQGFSVTRDRDAPRFANTERPCRRTDGIYDVKQPEAV